MAVPYCSPSVIVIIISILVAREQLQGSMKEPNISIYFFLHPSLNGVLFPMFCLLVEGECQMLVF